jgi:branched-chain amino acid transport system substrate-binding protein
MRKVGIAVFAVVAALGVFAAGASPATQEAGVTAKTVTIGGTFPLTGRASVYATIGQAMKAYFSYVNARRGPDGKRGVGGRQIVFKVYDDGYNPANTVQQARRLVEQDKVFAVVGALGTEHNVAIRPYLNQSKVPHLFSATGATTLGRDYKQFPFTTGWLPNYQFEGGIYGRKVARNSPNAKIAVLYQNDDYGKDMLAGFEAGLGAKASNIVAKESYEPTASDVRSQMAKLRASGATVLMIFAIPTYAVPALVITRALGWSPSVIYVNNVAATDTFMTLAQRSGAGDLVERVFSVQYAKDPASPEWDNDAGMNLYRDIMAKYYPSGRVTDSLNLYGIAVAHAFTQLLYKAGKNPTRAALIKAVRNWNEASPFLLPGVRQRTAGDDQFIVGCERVVKFTNGVFKAVSGVLCEGEGTS